MTESTGKNFVSLLLLLSCHKQCIMRDLSPQ